MSPAPSAASVLRPYARCWKRSRASAWRAGLRMGNMRHERHQTLPVGHGAVSELAGGAMALEKSLQTVFEKNLDALIGVRFLASEFSTNEGGRMDTLGIDENNSPVVIEYKRSSNENVINQGLYYLDWLMGHRKDFEWLVLEKLGAEVAKAVDWSGPRLICIAGDFGKYDEHAVKQMNRNIALIRYRRFEGDLLLLEQLTSASAKQQNAPVAPPAGTGSQAQLQNGYRASGGSAAGSAGPLPPAVRFHAGAGR